jgi:hypothetical protein
VTVDRRTRWTCNGCGVRKRSGRRTPEGDPRPPAGWHWAGPKLACPACSHWKGSPGDAYLKADS